MKGLNSGSYGFSEAKVRRKLTDEEFAIFERKEKAANISIVLLKDFNNCVLKIQIWESRQQFFMRYVNLYT